MPDITELKPGSISVEEMLARRKECTVSYYGHTVTFSYYVEKLTGSFSTDLVRYGRKGQRLRQRYVAELQRVVDMGADSIDPITAEKQDAEADEALAKLKAEEDEYNTKVAEMLQPVFAEWDLTSGGEPYSITVDNITALDPELISAMVEQLLRGGSPMGEASGSRSSKRSHSSSKRKG
jgi:hypothetical protein